MDALSPLTTPMIEETTGPTVRSVPDETVTLMPVQDLERWQHSHPVWPDRDRLQAGYRRTLVFLATLALTAAC